MCFFRRRFKRGFQIDAADVEVAFARLAGRLQQCFANLLGGLRHERSKGLTVQGRGSRDGVEVPILALDSQPSTLSRFITAR